jgi:hypothetical protein
MHATLSALKGSMQPAMTLAMLGILGLLPAAVQTPAVELFSRKSTAVVSNVPGPTGRLYLCGQRISEMYFWVPQSGSIGVGISVLTYAGQVFVGMIADADVVPDPQRVVDLFAPEFDRLRRSVGAEVLARERRASVAAAPAGARRRTRTATKPRIGTRGRKRSKTRRRAD